MSHRRVKDDKNSSALAMIHEMSDRAKKAGRNPTIINNRLM